MKKNNTMFWGVTLIVLGLVWLGNNMGWFYPEVPMIPLLLIAVGIHLVLKHVKKENPSSTKE